VIPNQENYITKDLNIDEYLTHFAIDKEGYIINVMNDASDLIIEVNKTMRMSS